MRLGLLTTFVTLRPGWLGFDTLAFPPVPPPPRRRPQPFLLLSSFARSRRTFASQSLKAKTKMQNLCSISESLRSDGFMCLCGCCDPPNF